jgi:hypothetical protein
VSTVAEDAPEAKPHGGYAAYHIPTRMERFWRSMGFRFHHGEDPEGVDDLPGWMRSEIRLNFSFSDRLRLLLTGRLRLTLTQYTPVQCDFAKNRLDWSIKAPGER